MARREFTITKFRFDEEAGFHRARVTCGEESVEVDNQFGSWQGTRRTAPRRRSFVRADVLPDVAALLQRKVPRGEKARRAS